MPYHQHLRHFLWHYSAPLYRYPLAWLVCSSWRWFPQFLHQRLICLRDRYNRQATYLFVVVHLRDLIALNSKDLVDSHVARPISDFGHDSRPVFSRCADFSLDWTGDLLFGSNFMVLPTWSSLGLEPGRDSPEFAAFRIWREISWQAPQTYCWSRSSVFELSFRRWFRTSRCQVLQNLEIARWTLSGRYAISRPGISCHRHRESSCKAPFASGRRRGNHSFWWAWLEVSFWPRCWSGSYQSGQRPWEQFQSCQMSLYWWFLIQLAAGSWLRYRDWMLYLLMRCTSGSNGLWLIAYLLCS